MSYCYEVHHTIKQILKKGNPSQDGLELIASELSPTEFDTALHLIINLASEKMIDGIIDCAGFDPDHFCRTFDISPQTLARWKTEGPTDFEIDTLMFLIVQFEIEEDRAIERMNSACALTAKIALLEDT